MQAKRAYHEARSLSSPRARHEISRSYRCYEIYRRDICYDIDINLDYIHIYYYGSRRETGATWGCNLVENTV